MIVRNHRYANCASRGCSRRGEGGAALVDCVAVVKGWEHTPNTPLWLIAVSLFGCRAHRHVQGDTRTRTWAPPTCSCWDWLVLTRGVIFRSTSVSTAWSNCVQIFLFFYLFLFKEQQHISIPIGRAGCSTTSKTVNHTPSFLLLLRVGGCGIFIFIFWSGLMLKSCAEFHSHSETISKYSRWMAGVAKWRLGFKKKNAAWILICVLSYSCKFNNQT